MGLASRKAVKAMGILNNCRFYKKPVLNKEHPQPKRIRSSERMAGSYRWSAVDKYLGR